eukprot:gnl/MRDRNA2_/MRDRNA2_31986_c0_seq1.p1 gnl/MRDRNA2_/MRDRNA2_31986_c0~~gnl/MRDRNA2_/MRDRNA2_31986_c0_seq1.p1  ORF type:complete len:713 (+),score=125.38 gnl/MRDRNA2_/MRDRNA2_31986_c0_seq1:276-2141(+)
MAAASLLIATKLAKASCGITLRQLSDELQDMDACGFASCTTQDIRRAEMALLNSTNFAPLRPTVMEFLQQLQRSSVLEGLRFNLAERFAALCIHDVALAQCAPSTLAAALVVVAYAVPHRDVRCDGEDSPVSGSSPVLEAQRQAASRQRARAALNAALRNQDTAGLLSAAPRALRASVPEIEVAPAAAALVQAVFACAADDNDVARLSIIGAALTDARHQGLDTTILAKHGAIGSLHAKPSSAVSPPRVNKWGSATGLLQSHSFMPDSEDEDATRALDALGVTLRCQPFAETKAWWRTPVPNPSIPAPQEEQHLMPRSNHPSVGAHSYVPGCIARFQPMPREPAKKSMLDVDNDIAEEKPSTQPQCVGQLYRGVLDQFHRGIPTPQWQGSGRIKNAEQTRRTADARRAASRTFNGDIEASWSHVKKLDAFSDSVGDLDRTRMGEDLDRTLQAGDSRFFFGEGQQGLSPSNCFSLGSPTQAWGPSMLDYSQSHRPFEPACSPRAKDMKPVNLGGGAAPGPGSSPGFIHQAPSVPKVLTSTTPPPDHCLLFKRPFAMPPTSRRPAACATQRTVSHAPVRFSALQSGLRAAPVTTASTRIAPGYKGMRRSPWLARECRARRSMA